MSADNENMMDDLLVKYLLGEADAGESREAELWINQNEANRKYYADFKLIWQESERIASVNQPDEDGAWLRLQNRIDKNDEQQTPALKPVPKFTWLKIAASILLISVVGYFAYNQYYSTKIASNNSTAALTQNLPDGSSVTLNNGSQLIYPNHFRGSHRLVQLSGEAFFKITHDKTKPFIIKINTATVSVVGTSFNVRNIKGKTEVIVETGIVKVKANGKEVLLHPGQKVIADEHTADLVVQETRGSLYNYYMTNALVCAQTPLHELVDKLNQVYNSHILIDNKQLDNLPITTTFKGQSLQQVLNVIAETFKIKVEKSGDQILLK
ncbi:FecR domain-containing protein [Mucilaginibacter sp. BJC16-A38]|uniref:FecR family protein n=1 Tax=Mucilaginibacter phenanthrenivorans TaxID=1234842 RepID=UPI0021579BCF|nr:FecR domain-containing protein [Mucilaginibacter phenanthrenivorans]MCR8560233.1 FecR domain-containing protein [Mucilaginibacter phenanthrenivorans]